MTDVIVPVDLWEEDLEGSIVLWLYRDGSQVSQGEVIAEILFEKVTLELLAPASGRLSIRVEPEISIRKGEVVAVIEEP